MAVTAAHAITRDAFAVRPQLHYKLPGELVGNGFLRYRFYDDTGMKKDDVLAWIHGFEAAREVERDLARKEPVDSAGSVAIGLSLTEFAGRCSDGELGRDRAREDDVRIVRERWAKLRRANKS